MILCTISSFKAPSFWCFGALKLYRFEVKLQTSYQIAYQISYQINYQKKTCNPKNMHFPRF